MKKLINLLIVLLPWKLRRIILVKCYHYEIDPTAKIGLSYIYPQYLEMKENCLIGHFNVGIHLDKIIIGSYSHIGRSNWITGCSTKKNQNIFHIKKTEKAN